MEPGGRPNDGDGPTRCWLDSAEQAAALEVAHTFPGTVPIVVIARHDGSFEDRLTALLLELLPGGALEMRRQASSAGRFVSVRLDVEVVSAEEAVALRQRLAALEGVVLLL